MIHVINPPNIRSQPLGEPQGIWRYCISKPVRAEVSGWSVFLVASMNTSRVKGVV